MPIDPSVQTLTNGQSQRFTLVDAAGAPVVPAAGAVNWTLDPPAGSGTMVAGLYTAPLVVAAEAVVTITAAPPGGPAEKATVRLVPVEVILAPAKVSLRGGETQRFDATVPGDPANAVHWNIAPGLGTLVNGLYTAPAHNQEDRDLQVIATSAVDPHKTATATVQLQSKPPWAGVTVGLFVYLVAIFSLVVLLISLWPPSADATEVKTWWGATVGREIDLLWLVLITGALGSFAYGARSFVDFVGNRALRASWSAWYLMYPFIGAALALIFYLAVRGGFLTAGSGQDVNVYGLTAVSGLVGMFSKQATTKLSELFATLFKTDKEDQNLKNKLGS
ncbi:MAG TPA: hypothetical protein VHR45_18985 [Thermoanaerobaculia bacterium]|nr:hypothetical protein [Thermoanaerobaculia bacterium]